MTLILALKWLWGENDEAVLITTDTQATTPFGIQYEVTKAKDIFLDNDSPIAIMSGAGDPALIKWEYNIAESIFLDSAKSEYPLSSDTFDKTIRLIERVFVARLAELRSNNITPSIQLIIGGVTGEGKARIYQFDNRGLAEPVHDDPGYSIIGHGFLTGGVLLLSLLGYDLYSLDLGTLSAFILDVVSDVDTTVGPFVGESYLMRVSQDEPEKNGKKNLNLGPLLEEFVIKTRDKIIDRRRIIQKAWKLCDMLDEKRVLEVINSLEEEAEKIDKEDV